MGGVRQNRLILYRDEFAAKQAIDSRIDSPECIACVVDTREARRQLQSRGPMEANGVSNLESLTFRCPDFGSDEGPVSVKDSAAFQFLSS